MVHVSETCEPTAPHLLTQVPRPLLQSMGPSAPNPIHEALSEKDLAPLEHFVDGAYISAALLATSRDEHGITRRGPTRPVQGWQAHTDGVLRSLQQFHGRLGAAAGALSPRQGLDRGGGSIAIGRASPYTLVHFSLRTAGPVTPGPSAPGPRTPGAVFISRRRSPLSAAARREPGMPVKRGGNATNVVLESKAPGARRAGLWPATDPLSGERRYRSTWRAPRSIWTGLSPGWRSVHGRRPGPRAAALAPCDTTCPRNSLPV